MSVPQCTGDSGLRVTSLRNHRATAQPWLCDCSMVTQITLKTGSPHGCFQADGLQRLIRHGPGLIILTDYDAATLITWETSRAVHMGY
jgi:hypothetical protein